MSCHTSNSSPSSGAVRGLKGSIHIHVSRYTPCTVGSRIGSALLSHRFDSREKKLSRNIFATHVFNHGNKIFWEKKSADASDDGYDFFFNKKNPDASGRHGTLFRTAPITSAVHYSTGARATTTCDFTYVPPISRASSHQVEGAGTPFCNGIYRMAPDVAENVPQSAYHSGRVRTVGGHVINSIDEEDVPKYTYQAKGGPLLTLFRCRMRTKASWWFIRCVRLQ